MSVAPLARLTSPTVVLAVDNVDTDQIIPARFLTGTTRDGLGRHLFADQRYDAGGAERKESVFNTPAARQAKVLVAGHNFGCGSSREHAVWALQDFGFRAVVSSSFADIFRNNALKNGLLPVELEPTAHRGLLDAPGAEVTIDVQAGSLELGARRVEFPLEPFARYCLLRGLDEFDFLLGQGKAIDAYEARRG